MMQYKTRRSFHFGGFFLHCMPAKAKHPLAFCGFLSSLRKKHLQYAKNTFMIK